jgi:hypothetical protein
MSYQISNWLRLISLEVPEPIAYACDRGVDSPRRAIDILNSLNDAIGKTPAVFLSNPAGGEIYTFARLEHYALVPGTCHIPALDDKEPLGIDWMRIEKYLDGHASGKYCSQSPGPHMCRALSPSERRKPFFDPLGPIRHIERRSLASVGQTKGSNPARVLEVSIDFRCGHKGHDRSAAGILGGIHHALGIDHIQAEPYQSAASCHRLDRYPGNFAHTTEGLLSHSENVSPGGAV